MHDTARGLARRVRAASLTAWLALAAGSGCASLMGSAAARLADHLAVAMLNQDDPETVRQAAPAYLLLADSLVEGDPESGPVLQTAARLYTAYAATFVEDPERVRRLTGRALDYADRALCAELAPACAPEARSVEGFAAALDRATAADVPAIFTWGVVHAGWIQAHSDDWNAIAELPRVEAAMRRVTALDEGYERGAAHLYLGILATLRPPALGGRPEQAREHFERAITLSGGQDLMARVHFARHYARLVFDRPLHDRLLNEVLAADPVQPGLTLSNVLAQQQARELLAGADAHF